MGTWTNGYFERYMYIRKDREMGKCTDKQRTGRWADKHAEAVFLVVCDPSMNEL